MRLGVVRALLDEDPLEPLHVLVVAMDVGAHEERPGRGEDEVASHRDSPARSSHRDAVIHRCYATPARDTCHHEIDEDGFAPEEYAGGIDAFIEDRGALARACHAGAGD